MTDLLDTGPLDDVAPAPQTRPGESSTRTITPRDVWRRARVPLALGALLLVVATVSAISAGRVDDAYLQPDSAGRPGARALAELLRNRGVTISVVERPSGASDVTVFVPLPELVPADVVAATTAADLVIVAPDSEYSTAIGAGIRPSGGMDLETRRPGCEQPDAVVAGKVLLGVVEYRAPAGAWRCYNGSFVEVSSNGQRSTVLGDGDFMTNEHLDEEGNAALALRLLTRHPTVEWVYPTEPFAGAGAGGEPRSLEDLLPSRVTVFTYQLFVVAFLLAAWRARRLGPVVVEPLPVVVRAAESVEGRARLYHAARARQRAAESLRAGLRDRLVRTLGLARDASRDTLVAAVAARAPRFDAVHVDSLLYGPPPADDTALVRLADDLDSLYTEVRAL